jgi:hypothetical protein
MMLEKGKSGIRDFMQMNIGQGLNSDARVDPTS